MILYSRLDDHKTYAEFWGASTKHPDSISCLQDDVERRKFTPSDKNNTTIADVLQWLMYVASTKTWFFHAMELIEDIQLMHDHLRTARVSFYD